MALDTDLPDGKLPTMYGEILKSLREARHLTLEQVAEKVALSTTQIHRFEKETREPRYHEIVKLADLYEVPVAIFFGEDEDRAGITYVPKLSPVSAGDWWLPEAIDEASCRDLKRVPAPGLPEGDWIALEVTGSSMDRISPPGSTIFVNRAEKTLVPNGCYVVADEQGRTTYKRYRPDPARFEPVTFSEGHETLFPNGTVTVLGRVRRSTIDM